MLELHLSFNWRHFARDWLVINGRLLVEDVEDAFCAGDGVLDVRPEHRNLLDGLVEALDISEEGHDHAQGDNRTEEGLSSEEVPSTHTGNNSQSDVG